MPKTDISQLIMNGISTNLNWVSHTWDTNCMPNIMIFAQVLFKSIALRKAKLYGVLAILGAIGVRYFVHKANCDKNAI